MNTPMRTFLLLVVALVPSLALAGPKKTGNAAEGPKAGPMAKTVGPCGAKVLPLVEGNSWTYSMVPAPAPPDDKIKRLVPAQPKTVVITVKSIEAKKGADTIVTLEEKITTDLTKDEKKPVIDEKTITTTITCGTKKFEISPDSFFFAGEPGGYYGLKVDSYEHKKGTSLQLTNGGIGDQEWGEDVAMAWSRVPTESSGAKLGSGKLELERRFTPQQPEGVTTKLAQYSAEKLALITTGRVTLDGAPPDVKPSELPANWLSTIWLANNVGVVQTLNSYAHMYQLTDATLK